MRERWATLLANATASTDGASVRAAFVGVLAELEPIDAAIVRKLYAEADEAGLPPVETIRTELGLDLTEFGVAAENLVRVGQAERARRPGCGINFSGAGAELLPLTEGMNLTAFGLAFVRACAPPREQA